MNKSTTTPSRSDAPAICIHLLPNAHLDPVWLWDWREGLTEAITTVRAVLTLMEEFSDLTFMRGESAIYEQIEKHDPASFKRIRQLIEAGRWDVVGGTVIQPDTNLPSTEVLCRQFERGLAYFQDHLGVRPTVAWQADSFGHSAGLPNILSSFGMTGFSFTRPFRTEFPMESPAFWWEGDHGNTILCYRQHWGAYHSDRGNLGEMLDMTLAGATQTGQRNVALQFGLGNHGGGPSRKNILDILAWGRRHPEVDVEFSTLHRLFATLGQELSVSIGSVPDFRGELGFCLRGCYSSAQKFKSLYRRCEAICASAEVSRSMIGEGLGQMGTDLAEAWDVLLFNAFHDILPGTSIERAMEEQSFSLGCCYQKAQAARYAALMRLAGHINISVSAPRRKDLPADVPFLLWNSLARPFQGYVEMEACLDYRPIAAFENRAQELPVVVYDHAGKRIPSQVIPTEHAFMPGLAWRKRVLVPVVIPALGWTVVRMGWRDRPGKQTSGECRTNRGTIRNTKWNVQAKDGAVHLKLFGKNVFNGASNLAIRVVEDPWGSWGGNAEEHDSFCMEKTIATWNLTEWEILEHGPLRAKLWTRWSGARSWLDLTFAVSAHSPDLSVEGRLLWNERSARLKLVLPCRGELIYDVPGSRIARNNVIGQVPGGRLVTRSARGKTIGFASDVLGDFDATDNELRVTLARATRFATDVPLSAGEKRWLPATDCGEMKFQFNLFDQSQPADEAADALTTPPLVLAVPASEGEQPPHGSFGALEPESVRLLSLEQLSEDRLRLRIQNRGNQPVVPQFRFTSGTVLLDSLGPQEIKTFPLIRHHGLWKLAGEDRLVPEHARHAGVPEHNGPGSARRRGSGGGDLYDLRSTSR